jgi:hypothetical protein
MAQLPGQTPTRPTHLFLQAISTTAPAREPGKICPTENFLPSCGKLCRANPVGLTIGRPGPLAETLP